MKHYLLIPVAAACMCLLAACSNTDKNASKNNSADEFDMPEEFMLSNRFSAEQIDSLKRMSRVIYQHLRITEDSIYTLDLTEEEAIKAGVDKKFYEDAVSDINSSNEMLIKAREMGAIDGHMLTPDELLEAVENAR